MKETSFETDSFTESLRLLEEFEAEFGTAPIDAMLDDLQDVSRDNTFDPYDNAQDKAYYLCKRSNFIIDAQGVLYDDYTGFVWDKEKNAFVPDTSDST